MRPIILIALALTFAQRWEPANSLPAASARHDAIHQLLPYCWSYYATLACKEEL